MTGVALSGRLTFADGAPALAGLLVTAFFFVGMTQDRGTSLLLLPIAIPCWVASNGGWSSELVARLPLAVGVWILVGETLALLLHQMRTLTEGLVHEASTDPLTGLGNRRDMGVALTALRAGDAVVVLDLDKFKLLNDRFGHGAGTKCWPSSGSPSAGCCAPTTSPSALVVRRSCSCSPGAHETGAREVLARLSGQWSHSQPDVTFSAGVCVMDTGTAQDALAAADQALYRAKQDGRNCWRFAGATAVSITSLA